MPPCCCCCCWASEEVAEDRDDTELLVPLPPFSAPPLLFFGFFFFRPWPFRPRRLSGCCCCSRCSAWLSTGGAQVLLLSGLPLKAATESPPGPGETLALSTGGSCDPPPTMRPAVNLSLAEVAAVVTAGQGPGGGFAATGGVFSFWGGAVFVGDGGGGVVFFGPG